MDEPVFWDHVDLVELLDCLPSFRHLWWHTCEIHLVCSLWLLHIFDIDLLSLLRSLCNSSVSVFVNVAVLVKNDLWSCQCPIWPILSYCDSITFVSFSQCCAWSWNSKDTVDTIDNILDWPWWLWVHICYVCQSLLALNASALSCYWLQSHVPKVNNLSIWTREDWYCSLWASCSTTLRHKCELTICTHSDLCLDVSSWIQRWSNHEVSSISVKIDPDHSILPTAIQSHSVIQQWIFLCS